MIDNFIKKQMLIAHLIEVSERKTCFDWSFKCAIQSMSF
jgi:hypothetical protein